MYKKLLSLTITFSLLNLTVISLAATLIWDGQAADSNWCTGLNWSTNSRPLSADWAYIGDWNSSQAARNAVIDSSSTCGPKCFTLVIGHRPQGSPASLYINGSSLSMSANLTLGVMTGSDGTLTMDNGNVTLSNGAVVVGDSGTGTLNVNGGVLTSKWQLSVGNNAGGIGDVNITGGMVYVKGIVYLGYSTGSYGRLTMSGGTLNSDVALIVGDYGDGDLVMTGGTINSVWQLYVGYDGGIGHVDLHGGTINASALGLGYGGGTGTMDITEGTLVMPGDHTGSIQGYIAQGLITGYNGDGIVNVEYDISTQYTTVSAELDDLTIAKNPKPADNEAGPGDEWGFPLSWTSGDGAEFHDIYFGTDFDDVDNADVSSDEYKGRQALEFNEYDPGVLDFGTYYWRIDQIEGGNVHKGTVWAFTKTVNKPTIYHLNLTNLGGFTMEQQYDLQHVAACVQGLVNRDTPRVFLSFPIREWFNNDDLFWLDRIRDDGGLCYGWKVREIANIEALLETFREYINGVVLYDPNPNTGVISTSLVATTVAGVEGGVAVRKDTSPGSMYNYLVNDINGPQLPVLVDLAGKFTGSGTIWDTNTPSTGSAKCDAYIWAKEKYLDTGRCNPTLLMYKMDLWGLKLGYDYHWQLGDLDYGVRNKGFCFELSPYDDEIPNDDPSQPMGTDLETYKKILNACNIQTGQTEMIKFCGFPNWPVKYSDSVGGLHDGGHLEGTTVSLLSAYNTYLSFDGGDFCNASFYAGLLPEFKNRRYVQNPSPTYSDMISRGLIDSNGAVVEGNYIAMMQGDYDGASVTLYGLAGQRYDDPARGEQYINWAVNPNAVERASVAIDYMRRNQSDKDYFVAGDSGSGYVYPHKLHGDRTPSGYPDGTEIWQKHNRKYYRLLDYSISGWLHSGYLGDTLSLTDCETYAPFSGDGIVLNDDTPLTDGLFDNMPYKIADAPWVLTIEANEMINYPSGVHFATYHLPFWYPTEMKDLEDEVIGLGNNHRFLDAYTFFYLQRYHAGGNNNYRATWVSDTIPRIMEAGQSYLVTVTVRNDGWDTWNEANQYRLGHAVVPVGTVDYWNYYHVPRATIPQGLNIASGQSVTFSFPIIAPSNNGNYELYYDMVRENVTWFKDKNNIEWKKEIIVATNETDIDTDSDGCSDIAEDAMGLLYWNPDDRIRVDISCDGVVNMADLAIIGSSWLLEEENLPEDLNNDSQVNLEDFTILAENWLIYYAH